jgi:predicted exporter
MKREEDQQLWDLLGRTRPIELSPFFARNVVRKTRTGARRFIWLQAWLRPRKLVPLAGVAVALVAAILAMHQPGPRSRGDNTPDVIAKIDPQDYDVIADLDELLAADDNSLWDDDAQTL